MPTKQQLIDKANVPAEWAMRLHPYYRGKVQVLPKCTVRNLDDFSIWYTPGVAAPCKAIHADPDLVYEHTNKANTIAVVSDGTRVLGLGNIGPEAGLPVMEGKALLFKYLGGVDAVPLCIDTTDADEIVETVKALQPSFGGINLEDIEQPKCFAVLDRLRSIMKIPVWHDDQQGTATVVLAALINALKLVGKDLHNAKIVMVGMGAANVATYRLLKSYGISTKRLIACDSRGTLYVGRNDIEKNRDVFKDKWRVCTESNVDAVVGGPAEALRGADVCVAISKPGPEIIKPEWITGMADDPIVLACANPVPEIWPWDAKAAGARVVCTGRSDFPNQVNNSLGFPAIFRGVLDVRARTITDEMAIAAATELAACVQVSELDDERVLPRMDEWQVYVRVAAATAMAAQREGVAQITLNEAQAQDAARKSILAAQAATHILMDKDMIPAHPSLKELEVA